MLLSLDANVLFAAAFNPEGRVQRLFDLAELKACDLLSSAFAIEEARRNLTVKRPKALERYKDRLRLVSMTVEPAAELIAQMAQHVPANDAPILAGAIAARADVLVTGDRRHFGDSYGRSIGGVLVLTPREALAQVIGETAPR
ncbi:MAG: PIN domain-containing protein [Trueperaceae bacterium]